MIKSMPRAQEEPRPWLVDTTLRDGEQTPGVSFTAKQKIEVAEQLAAAGIPEIEAGTPAMGRAELPVLSQIIWADLPCRISLWCRAHEMDLTLAATLRAEAVHMSLPVSEVHLSALGKPFRWVEDQLDSLSAFCRAHFQYFSVGAQDASRASVERLIQLAQLAESQGAHRFRLADSVGLWSPSQTQAVFTAVTAAVPDLTIGFHGHNDLGLATANCLAAFEGGARSLDVTVLGLGERAGNAPLEQVVMAFSRTGNLDCGVQTQALSALCSTVATAAGETIPPDRPVIGERAFLHESGIHVRSLLKDRATYEPFHPGLVGREQGKIVYGKHSGSTAIRHALCSAGLRISRGEANQFLDHLRDLSSSGGYLNGRDLLRAYQTWCATDHVS